MTAPTEPRFRTAGQRAARFLRHHPDGARRNPEESRAGSNGRGDSGPDGQPDADGRASALSSARVCQVGWVDLYSVAKIALGFYIATLVSFLVAMVMLWTVAAAVGVVGSVERFAQDLGFEGFRLLSGTLLLAVTLLGLAA